jgi:hypothetical protein
VVDRIQQGGTASISVALTVAGTAQDPTPDSATVTITRADGTAVVTDVAASDSGTGVFSYPLDPSETALLDTLTATWTFTADGSEQSRQTFHEVVGGFLFTLGELEADLNSTETYASSELAAARTYAETQLEHYCGVAFVPRYERETLNGTYGGLLQTKWARVRTVRDVTVDTVVGTPGDYVALREGHVYASSTWWTSGYGNVTVGYEHGYDTPPLRIKRAALILAKRWITPGAFDDRAISQTTDSGTYALFQAGVRGHLFDVPEVQAAVDQYNLSVGVA